MQKRTIEWHKGIVTTIDQTKLPEETVFFEIRNHADMADAIKTMKIRGAPLLGVAAAFALALAANNSRAENKEELLSELERASNVIRATRPTAVNLFWAIDRILNKVKGFSGNVEETAAFVVAEAQRIADEDAAANRSIGKHGATLICDGDTVLTHCNAGALATVEYGTALGVLRAAWEKQKKIKVVATETRPLLQGARLTVYELKREGIPVTLITDNMVGYVMYKRLVNKVVVGADRIVQDAVINKIGTYSVAVLARHHGIPFYVAAPKSTFDFTRNSADVVIEERNPDEVTHVGMQQIAPEGVKVLNPAFDVTPLEYVTAIICESGILYKEDFRKLKSSLHKQKA
ncbi:MAG TPA: S-methyl-5-thioribose-1-phosphate isomerase [Candidatus Bathyarchaeia archaeon]|nr:S-methyl-5-thioribose-1-phosphate isomerase [Candidatus Bathyarchaeia archaeon]